MSKNLSDSIPFSAGSPSPLGASVKNDTVNFALFSEHATKVTLGLFEEGKNVPSKEVPLNKTGSIWHVKISGLPQNTFYAYRVDGPEGNGHRFDPSKWVLDPFAKGLYAKGAWGEAHGALLGEVFPSSDFNWEGDAPPNLRWEEMILYEMHLRGYTQDSSSQAKNPGTYLGMIEKIPHLQKLGVNAAEILPIFPFDETSHMGENLFNYWGYSTIHFFSPMSRYAKDPRNAINECKEMVKALHKANIEVILDVVFNHTAEGNECGPTLTFRGIDNASYYLLDEQGNDLNFSGCGNTFACNRPCGMELIVSALRYWVEEFHIDGFRFDLASIFCRGENGEVLENPPLIEAICNDPALSNTKFIAEAWDCGGLYQVGSFPGGRRFAEWNGKYRDVVRRFLKGTDGQVEDFARAICGSEDLYGNGRSPYHSINFVTAHDGFTLRDLASYNGKHNEANGEDNQDGNDWNESWNCGEEGETTNSEVQHLRERQMRNFLFTLALSMGTPMILMGDEYGHTRNGNNNTYCQDNRLNYFLWDELEKNQSHLKFLETLIAFRKKTRLFHRKKFLNDQEIAWHGTEPSAPDWSHESRFIAYSSQDLYIAFNAHYDAVDLTLPEGAWKPVIDTVEGFLINPSTVESKYRLSSHSCLLLSRIG